MKLNQLAVITTFALLFSLSAQTQYTDWRHSGTIYIITTPEGTALPAFGFGTKLSSCGTAE